jgi:hypothetical protein
MYFEERDYFGLEKSQARLALNPKPMLIVVSEFWMKWMLWDFEVPSHSEIQVGRWQLFLVAMEPWRA